MSCNILPNTSSPPAGHTSVATPPIGDKHGLDALEVEKVCHASRRNRRGAAAVEFAVVAPLFFLLIFGMIEFGRMVMVQQVITNASREGARIAVLDGTTTADVVAQVNSYLSSAGIGGATIVVSDSTGAPVEPGAVGFGQGIRVGVGVPFGAVSWLPAPMFLDNVQLDAETVMRRETVQ